MIRSLLSAFTLAASMATLAGCVDTTSSATSTPIASATRAVSSLPAPARTPIQPGSDPLNGHVVPVSGHAEQGLVYRYELYAHCGVTYFAAWDFDGSFWDVAAIDGATPATHGLSHPPAGISDPFDVGTIELVAQDEARFISSNGIHVDLVRSSDIERADMFCV